MKLHEQISDGTYSCGICAREVKKGEYHHNHDNYINGKTWGLDALIKQAGNINKKKYIRNNPTTKKERYENRGE